MSQYIFPSITEQVTVSGTLHIATVAAGAMFFHDSIDFSAYANRGYKLEFKDAAGKKAWAFGGAVGGGEALSGSELVLNGTSWTGGPPPAGWVPTDCTLAAKPDAGPGGVGDTCCELTRTGGTFQLFSSISNLTLVIGTLYKASMAVASGTAGDTAYKIDGVSTFVNMPIKTGNSAAAWATVSSYVTGEGTAGRPRMWKNNAAAGTMLFDNISVQALTNVPATGLHLNSTPFGTDRTMAGSESGFNPNTVVLVRILGKAKQGRGRILGI